MSHVMLPLAVTMAEPAGVGGEIALAAWAALRAGGPSFFVIDDIERLRVLAARIGLAVPLVAVGAPSEAAAIFSNALPVLAVGGRVDATPGRLDAANANAVVRSIEMAVEVARQGLVGGIVTNPIQKSTLYDAGFKYPGHTEFLGALAGKTRAHRDDAGMP